MIHDIHGDVFQWLFKPKTVCPSLSLVDELVDTPLVPEEDRQVATILMYV